MPPRRNPRPRSGARRRTYARLPRAYRKYKSRFGYDPRTVDNRRLDVHYFKRQFNWTNLSGNALYNPWLSSATFSLAQLPGTGDFTTLFDRYKITFIKLYIWLKIDPSAQTAATASYPKLYWVKDYDDSSTPASLDELRQHQSCKVKVMSPNRPIVITLRPSILSVDYRGVGTVSYTPKWKQWVDMQNLDVPMYGLKLGVDDFTNTNYRLEMEGKMWFACKDTR